jgi:hypothetical protein
MSLFAPATCDHERAENAADAPASAECLRKVRRVSVLMVGWGF